MTATHISHYMWMTVKVGLMVGVPVLAAALAVGLMVGIFQAATQINEQTLAFVPKIIVVTLVTVMLAPWMGHALVQFTQTLFQAIPHVVSQ